MAQIAQAMPSNSSLVIKVDAQNNTAADGTAYPVKNGTAWNFGTLCVYRANVNRVAFLFFATDKCIYTGTYNSGVYNWSGWSQMATAEHPQKYDLPLADGWQAIIPSLYAKNQFSEVTINARLKYTGNFERGAVFATLPEGYRPNKQVTVFARVVNSQNQSNFGHIDITQDGEMFLYADGAAGAPLNEVFMPSISFIAGS